MLAEGAIWVLLQHCSELVYDVVVLNKEIMEYGRQLHTLFSFFPCLLCAAFTLQHNMTP